MHSASAEISDRWVVGVLSECANAMPNPGHKQKKTYKGYPREAYYDVIMT